MHPASHYKEYTKLSSCGSRCFLTHFYFIFAANLTKEVKEKMQEEARSKYGLTAEQIKEASDQVDELIADAQATAGANQEDVALLSKFS
jgi:hypothetical protein